MELRPNVLLTRYPIVFYPGKKTLFYHNNYWQIFPQCLAEHGNDVFHLNLPWHSTKKRQTIFHQIMNEYPGKYHLIVDDLGFEEIAPLLAQLKHRLASVIWVSQQPATVTPSSPVPVYTFSCRQKTHSQSMLFRLHSLIYPKSISPNLTTDLQNAMNLLSVVEKCAEQDLQEVPTCDVI